MFHTLKQIDKNNNQINNVRERRDKAYQELLSLAKAVAFLGNASKSRDERSTVVELVILLRATIGRQPKPHEQDIDLYRRYNNDPRPIDRR